MTNAGTADARSANPGTLTQGASATVYSTGDQSVGGTYENGRVRLDLPVDWPEGTPLHVTPMAPVGNALELDGRLIVVGFGLAGRCVADLLDQAKLSFTIIEKNPVTVMTQRALGRNILLGDVIDSKTLIKAGVNDAAVLALTIPDEAAVLKAVALARRLQPKIYIIARTNYSSQGMKASQLGADDVVKAEHAVALQFYEKLSRHIHRSVATKV